MYRIPLEQQLAHYEDAKQKWENTKSRLEEIFTILDGLKNHQIEYDDTLIRQTLECVVENAECIKVIFKCGYEVDKC